MILFPPAKINLGLNVRGIRPDGYHEIETCMIQIPINDVLEIVPFDQLTYKQSGLDVGGEMDDNLVVKAFRLIKEKYGIPDVYLHLLKNIPMGAGLGGGSADATYTLVGLNNLFELKLSSSDLQVLAAKLGSDCPFFVNKSFQLAKGRGEILNSIELDLKGKYLKIINPGIHIGTKEAYQNVDSSVESNSILDILEGPMIHWKEYLKNDFETFAFDKHPLLQEIKTSLYSEGAIYASMTGSGSTLFGIFSTKPKSTYPSYFERIVQL